MVEDINIYEERFITTYKDGETKIFKHHVVKEIPLSIYLNKNELATIFCSPNSIELLAIGFLVSEGVLQKLDELKKISYSPEKNAIWIDTTDGSKRADGFQRRNFASRFKKAFFAKASADEIIKNPRNIPSKKYSINEIIKLSALLDKSSNTFKLTGGVHEAALANNDGFILYCEDIGRHNALNRILGYSFLNNLDTSDKAIVISSRISSEIMIKVVRIGIPLVISRSAITGLAIDMANQLGITVVGFARGKELNIYSHSERILATTKPIYTVFSEPLNKKILLIEEKSLVLGNE
ncbi:MAG: formate dehydrogenase accessory sulfurtransferase FdhD [Anaerolineales bacterium]|nr:formate dehydrogenase accessory sulfurtransferase FdhD [Anaerolineales bacterium]